LALLSRHFVYTILYCLIMLLNYFVYILYHGSIVYSLFWDFNLLILITIVISHDFHWRFRNLRVFIAGITLVFLAVSV